jgi:hypothetical protein
MVEQVRRVNERRRLIRQRPRERRMAVAERRDADAGNQIEIAFARLREERAARARLEHHRRAAVHLQHMLRVQSDRINEIRCDHR